MDGQEARAPRREGDRRTITPDYPTPDQIRAYGAFTFLFLRSPHHEAYPLKHYRAFLQPAIDLGFYKVIEVEGVPRAGITWAFLGPETERLLASGRVPAPPDWVSGPQIWIMDVIAPFGRGLGARLVRQVLDHVPAPATTVRFARFRSGKLKHVTEYVRTDAGAWSQRRILPDQFETLSR